METYIVQYGDTLERVAEKHLGSKERWYEIAQFNNILGPYQLFVGQILKLPNKLTVAAPGVVVASVMQEPATMALARGFLFVIFEQLPDVGSNKVIRKIAMIPEDFSKHPDLYPKNSFGNLTPAQHALGNESQFLSASNRPHGSPTNVSKDIDDFYQSRKPPRSANPKDFIGKQRPVLVDLQKLAPGTRIITEQELILDLNRLGTNHKRARTLINAIQSVEGEVLIESGLPQDSVKKLSNAHTPYILTAEELQAKHKLGHITEAELNSEIKSLTKAYNRAKIVGRVGRVITVVGVIFTVKDVAEAAQRSYQKRSYRPLAAETVRQIGGWAGAVAGAKVGLMAGAAFGIVTGPGAIISGAIGAIAFGAVGYFMGNKIAGLIEDDSVEELRKDVNRVEDMKGRVITLMVGNNESQYDFCRRALIVAGTEAQNVSFNFNTDRNLPIRFADKFYPISSSDTTKDFKMNWIAGDPSNDGNNSIRPTEWKAEQGTNFTYRLGDNEVNELIKMLFNLSR